MGRTMDYEVPLNYNFLYFPRGYNYAEDLDGNKLINKYAMMGLAFEDWNPLKDGVNEHGLIGVTNLFIMMNGFHNNTEADKLNISTLDYFSYVLGNFKSVDEIIEDLPNIHCCNRNSKGEKIINPDFHFYFADAHGKSVIVEPFKKKLTAFVDEYNVLTNSPPLPNHIRRLKRFYADKEIQGSKDLPGAYDPVSRFIRAYYHNENHVPAKNNIQALEHMYSMLETLSIPKGAIPNESYGYYTYTRYRCAYDTLDKMMTVRTERNTKIYSLTIDDFKGVEDRVSLKIPNEPQFEKLNKIF